MCAWLLAVCATQLYLCICVLTRPLANARTRVETQINYIFNMWNAGKRDVVEADGGVAI